MNVILLAALLSAAALDPVVARVDGHPIIASEIREQLLGTRGAASSATPGDALQVLISETLLAEEAERQGLDKDPALREAIESEKQRAITDRFLEREIDGGVRVDEAAVRSVFHSRADVVRLSSIRVASEPEARAILDRLAKGASFAQEGRATLDFRYASKGGEMGDVSRGDLEPALAELAFSAPLDKPAGPCRLELGFAVIKVSARVIGSEKEFLERREGLEKYVRQQTIAQMRHHYTQVLRGKAGVKLDEAFLLTTGARLSPTAEERRHPIATIDGRPVAYSEILPDLMALSRGREGGHLSGPRVKMQVASAVLDRKVIESAMQRSGYAARPEVVLRAAGVRRLVLARAFIAKFRSERPNAGDESLLKLLGDLHSRAQVTTDDAALQAAAKLD